MLFPGGENFGTGSFDKKLRMHHGQLDIKKFPREIYHINKFVILDGKVVRQETLTHSKTFPVNFFEN